MLLTVLSFHILKNMPFLHQPPPSGLIIDGSRVENDTPRNEPFTVGEEATVFVSYMSLIAIASAPAVLVLVFMPIFR